MTITLQNPYLAEGFHWLRGNLHTHTTFSDGRLAPEEVLARYEEVGYDFLALSDHDVLVPPEAYRARTRMVLIPADEVTRNGSHILAVQIREVIPPDPDRQAVLDAIVRQGGFAILNHPNWQKHFNHFPQEQMEQLQGYTGIEIYNGVVERLEGSALATDRWDRLLSNGRHVWGYAHDDFHRLSDFARGWNVVQVADRSVEAICDALRQGRFYASTGVAIERIALHDDTLSIATRNAQRIRFVGEWGVERGYVDEPTAEYKITGNEGAYVRIECYGAGIQAAWTQPFFLSL